MKIDILKILNNIFKNLRQKKKEPWEIDLFKFVQKMVENFNSFPVN